MLFESKSAALTNRWYGQGEKRGCLPKHERTGKANMKVRKGSPKHERTDKTNMNEKWIS